MLIYLYDGSFDGILTCIFDAYYKKHPDRILSRDNVQLSIGDEFNYIETDDKKASRVYDAILKKISDEALKNAFYTYLSEDRNSGTIIYNYLKLGFKLGKNLNLHLEDENVFKVQDIVRRVSFEVHRFTGLLRFSELSGGIYYAKIEPDNNITMLLAPHFKDRFKDQRWIIHDTKRNIAALYNLKDFIITDSIIDIPLSLSKKEEFFQSLWKEYFKSISIKERTNPRLQKNHMPIRYWKNLIEKRL